MTAKLLPASFDTPERRFLEKMWVDRGIMVEMAFEFRLQGFGREKGQHLRSMYISRIWEADALNRS
jgi:hypothetical protein